MIDRPRKHVQATPDRRNAFTPWAVLRICLRISKPTTNKTNSVACLATFCYIMKIIHQNVFLKTFAARNNTYSCWIWISGWQWFVCMSLPRHSPIPPCRAMHCTAAYIENVWKAWKWRILLKVCKEWEITHVCSALLSPLRLLHVQLQCLPSNTQSIHGHAPRLKRKDYFSKNA